ncbi:hypothetical protein BaRGS_00032182, partial [Batillaria attramentaria]
MMEKGVAIEISTSFKGVPYFFCPLPMIRYLPIIPCLGCQTLTHHSVVLGDK